jgi:hypothetical protein
MEKDIKQSEPRVIGFLEDLAVWFFGRTNRFPKNYRVSLGEKIDDIILEMLEIAHKARFESNKMELLKELSGKIEILRIYARLALRLGCIQGRQYEFVSRQIDEIGRQIGGWIKRQSGK